MLIDFDDNEEMEMNDMSFLEIECIDFRNIARHEINDFVD